MLQLFICLRMLHPVWLLSMTCIITACLMDWCAVCKPSSYGWMTRDLRCWNYAFSKLAMSINLRKMHATLLIRSCRLNHTLDTINPTCSYQLQSNGYTNDTVISVRAIELLHTINTWAKYSASEPSILGFSNFY